jgi:hypothetical protein
MNQMVCKDLQNHAPKKNKIYISNANGKKNISIKKMRIIDKTKKSQNKVGSKSYRPSRKFKFRFAQDNCDTLNLKFSCFKP